MIWTIWIRSVSNAVNPDELDNLSHLLQRILPVHQQREVKKQFEKMVPQAIEKLKTADVLNKLQSPMRDVKICSSVKDILNLESNQYIQFQMDIQKEARKQVFESEKNDSEKTVKTKEDCNVTAIANKYKELTEGFSGVRCDISFSEIVNKMIEQYTKKLQKLGDYALVLYSFEGAEHGSDKTNVISFSTQIYLHAMEKTITTTTSCNLYLAANCRPRKTLCSSPSSKGVF